MTNCGNDVGNNCTCGGKLSCTHSVKHGGSQAVTYDADTVKHTVNTEKRVRLRNHHRDNISKVLIFYLLYRTKKLYGHVKLMSIREIKL